jgi:hypothetical protein
MQHLVLCPLRGRPVSKPFTHILAQVRFLAYHRIKPHAPPLVRTPVNSFEFHCCQRTPQVDYLAVSLSHYTNKGITASNHRLRHGLPGYLILFAPHAFVPQCQSLRSSLPSQSVFRVISMHFTATQPIPATSTIFKLPSIQPPLIVKRPTFKPDLKSHLRTL